MIKQKLKVNLLQVFLLMYVFFSVLSSSIALFALYQSIPMEYMIDSRYIVTFLSDIVSILIFAFIAFYTFMLLNNVKNNHIFSSKNITMLKTLAIVSYINAIQVVTSHLFFVFKFPLSENVPKLSLVLGFFNNRWMLFLALGLLFHILSETFFRAKQYKSEVDLTV